MEKKSIKMYHLVHRSLSPIQKGIQAGHGAIELCYKYRNEEHNKVLREFAADHKTFIVLDGGYHLDMKEHMDRLERLGVLYASFEEPDMNGLTTCISFLSDEENIGLTAWVSNFKFAN